VRYVGLFLLVNVVWLLVAISRAAQKALLTARTGTALRGTSILGFLSLGWTFFAGAIAIDFLSFSPAPGWPRGFWAVLVLHALPGVVALAYWAYAEPALRRKSAKERR